MTKYHLQIHEIIDRAIPQIQSLKDDYLNRKPSETVWSKKEILGHLVDSAHNNHQRFLRAREQSNLIFSGYAQADWVRRQNYQQRSSSEILALWAATNKHIAFLLEQLTEAELSRSTTAHNFHQICMRPLEENASTSLAYLVEDYIYHLEHHLAQIIPEGEVKIENVKLKVEN